MLKKKKSTCNVLRNSERRATSLGNGRKPGVAAAKTSLEMSDIAWIGLVVEVVDGFRCQRRLLFDGSDTLLPPSCNSQETSSEEETSNNTEGTLITMIRNTSNVVLELTNRLS